MKLFTHYCAVLLAVGTVLYGQSAAAQINFQNRLGTELDREIGVSGVQLTDETNNTITGYMTLSQHYNANNIPSISLLRLEANGAVSANVPVQLTSGVADVAHHLQKTHLPDGMHNGYIIVGETNYGPADGYDMFMTRTDLNGNVLWAKRYGLLNNQETGRCVQQTPEGGFIAVGTSTGPNQVGQVMVVKTDANGTVEWSRIYSMGLRSTATYVEVVDFFTAALPSFIITGSVQTTNGNNDALLLRLDHAGEFMWAGRYYAKNSTAEIGTCVKPVAGSNDGFVVTAELATESGGVPNNLYVFKVSTTGSVVWGNAYQLASPSNQPTTRVRTTGLIQHINTGEFTVAGDLLGQKNGVYLLRLNANGNPQWAKLYNHFDQPELSANDIRVSLGGGCVVTGTVHAPNGSGGDDNDLYVLRLPMSGELVSPCPDYNLLVKRKAFTNVKPLAALISILNPEDLYELEKNNGLITEDWCGEAIPAAKTEFPTSALQLYPNPANNEVVVVTPNIEATTLTVRLFDIKGSLLATYPHILPNERLVMDLTNQSEGFYFVEITNSSGAAVDRAKLVISR